MRVFHRISKLLRQHINFVRTNEVTFSPATPDLNQDVINATELEKKFTAARETVLSLQHKDGHWCFPLEADCTIPAEYILMMHFMDEVDVDLEIKLARFIRAQQDLKHGGWPLYYGGHLDLSCTVKAYYALKLAGDSPDTAHMARARAAVLEQGGAARANVFTRIVLAMYDQIPWRGIPVVPAELILLPRWFPFHLSKVSYWSRAVMVPLSILCTLKARAANPRRVQIRELFTVAPEDEQHYFPPALTRLNRLFMLIERVISRLEPLFPQSLRRFAVRRAERWIIERLNGECGLGAIFPAMVNAHEALALLGYAYDHPYREQCRKALQGLLVDEGEHMWCQPCTSPVWDTVLTCLALQEDQGIDQQPVREALDWLVMQQILEEPGDWRDSCPQLLGGGWAFQYANPHYPDLDDTAAVAWALHQGNSSTHHQSLARAANWLAGMQSGDGGFAAFDIDNTCHYLNEIPFADHGALIDPPTSDVTARCVGLLAKYGESRHQDAVQNGMAFLFREQESNGAWFGRWGTNYIYGTWSVLEAFRLAKLDTEHTAIRRAVQWLLSVQREDGGWGESNDTYFKPAQAGQFETSTSFQTAWALLGLMAAGEVDSRPVRNGINYLLRSQSSDGLWEEPWFTAPGFPRVFYLKYHGYSKYFPLWALARYRALLREHTA
ncbi:squalene-hopene/tetraprenyl-beta-curcumene cyclase [Nitrosomonas cryotolerans]|uniref:Squalene-hopene/tetraprenyl-beta-curcumene cyclase n=1 Tax=Nitrosomonas cryotolerans ATCC 49181 TaxID=1131553 RepID=A0A1N6GIA8_9PROT|nr:squalene--hopene cyclase [Nitrosomonas cryotolerans]SFP56656.1 squalene-hopene/tetraprenyl-beta-curcumene cyclase [Nitrosomonas cryotolerans]SIO07280.1 squalene-hopene/tetraprenyl-beta-curcumene cyclase [Nitrosomonas cryotolerans ATCC 49181]